MRVRHARMSRGGSIPMPIMDLHLPESVSKTSEQSKLAPYLMGRQMAGIIQQKNE